MIKLYSYFRSSSSYRVRIALNLKNQPFETVPVHLLNDGGEQFKEAFSKVNGAHRIPSIDHSGKIISQSVAIMEYLETQFPTPALYPTDSFQKALCRQLVEIINSDIQPLQNLSVLKKLVNDHGFTDDQKENWIRHWISLGFASFEKLLNKTSGEFCVGDSPGVADCFLIPQVYNAIRFKVDMTAYPKIVAINEKALKLEAFILASPENQPDAPKSS